MSGPGGPAVRPASFGDFVRRAGRAGTLVVQPRMGMSDPGHMRAGLQATRRASATTAGTITVDSFTRLGDLRAARSALRSGAPLNGYPIVTHPVSVTRTVLDGLAGPDFPVQVRHGSAAPRPIFNALIRAGLHASEGGPVSYCLPYGRTPLRESVRNWREACETLARTRHHGLEPHLETFGGCMMGQLCPPGLLVALSVLEALFFCQHGLRDVSLSYAQQAHRGDDEDAIRALRTLAHELLPGVGWHIVLYTYMGVFPRSAAGCNLLLDAAADLAAATGTERLVVKTTAEAHRLPTVAENVAALQRAARAIAAPCPAGSPVLDEARALVGAVLELHDDVGRALVLAFEHGYLDVPYCLHPDNPGRARSYLDGDGRLRWATTGRMPLRPDRSGAAVHGPGPDAFLRAMNAVAGRFDRLALERAADSPAQKEQHDGY